MPEEYRRKDVRSAGDNVAAGAVANAAQYLRGVHFPARREDLERVARDNGADESALQEIRALPQDRSFRDPGEVFRALGDEVERAHERAQERG